MLVTPHLEFYTLATVYIFFTSLRLRIFIGYQTWTQYLRVSPQRAAAYTKPIYISFQII